MIFFVGEMAAGGDQTRMVQYVLEPPEPISTFLYRCDSEFFLEPLSDMLLDKKIYGLIVIDRSEATIGYSGARGSPSSATSHHWSHPSTAWEVNRRKGSSV